LTFGLNLLGIAVVAVTTWTGSDSRHPAWITIMMTVALAGWAVRSVLRLYSLPGGVWPEFVMVIAGSIAAGATTGLGLVMVAVAIVFSISRIERPLTVGLSMAALSLVIVPFAAAPFGQSLIAVSSMEAGVLVAVLVGVSRRQFRKSEKQNDLLRERDLDVRAEHSRAELLAERQQVARDIHDVLAHSLGGLVIQLDAVEALLEAGDVAGAEKRVTDARALAASGLSEARRAVAALRDSGDGATAPVSAGEFEALLSDLVSAHRSLGGVIEFSQTGHPRELPAESAQAVQRAFQESLSNARKHAPGEPVTARLDWADHSVRLTMANPLPDSSKTLSALAVSGGGHGLTGMRERFSALPLGGSVTAEVDRAEFLLVAEAGLQ
jgi:signal transduction histidine kinase